MWRLTDRIVRSTLVTAWRLATSPTSTSPFFANATTDGVVREPSAFAMTVGSPPSRTATTEFVVPRSMPTARAMEGLSLRCDGVLLVQEPRARGGSSSALRPVRSTFLPTLTAARATVFPGVGLRPSLRSPCARSDQAGPDPVATCRTAATHAHPPSPAQERADLVAGVTCRQRLGGGEDAELAGGDPLGGGGDCRGVAGRGPARPPRGAP